MTGRIAEHSDQLKKLKEDDGLVVEALPGLEALQNSLQNLRVKKKDLESHLSSLERAAVNPRKVRSESVKSWFGKFDSLEANVYKLVAAATSANTPNAAAEVVATHTQQNSDIQTMSRMVTELFEQLKKLKEEDDLVVEAYPELQTLLSEMEKVKADKIDLESIVSGLESAPVNPPKVRSERVKLYFREFDFLEAEVSEMKVSMESVGPAETTSNGAAAETRIQQLLQRVTELSEELKRLKQDDGLALEARPQHIHELPGQSADFVVGIEEKLEEVDKLLDDEETKVILIHGMGGSGKTTLVREVTKKLKLRSRAGNGFDFIFSVVVSQDLNIHKIQGDVFVQLGYKRDDPSLPQSIDDRANVLKRRLNEKSFLLVLDDVWKPLHDLSKLGFQYSSSKKCKVVVTSRNQDVCEARESLRIFEIGFLEKEHAWQLFCRVCKRGLIESEGQVKSLAWKMVEKCSGLPLLLKTLAGAMVKNRGYEDWFVAESQLRKYPDVIKGIDQVYEVLKFSFDRLENDGLRVCLLYCALFREDEDVPVDRLIPYLMAEGFVDGRYDFDTLWKKARHDIIEKLKESSLLETGKYFYADEERVKLHDAVREMLLSLGEDWKVLNCDEKGNDGRIDVDSWNGVRMASVWDTEDFEKITHGEVTSSSLRTLLVRPFTDLAILSSPMPFVDLPTSLQFSQFSSLRILDLSWNDKLSEIPKSIGSLKSLLYLSLSSTRIKELPVEIGNLTNLYTLDLSRTDFLYDIPQDAISPLKMLQSLNLFGCKCFEYKREGMLKVEDVSTQLPKLKDVGLSLFFTIDVAERLFPLTSQLSLKYMDIDNVMSSKFLKLPRLKNLQIYDCTIVAVEFLCPDNFPQLKRLQLGSVRLRNIILKSPYWCLQDLKLWSCHEFEHLGWIRHLPNLRVLTVGKCEKLQELLTKDMSEENSDESSCRYDDPTILLSKLEEMELDNLPKLESISSGNLPFPCLTEMCVQSCPRIRSLPIKSSNSVRTEIHCEKEWWESLEWEDDECSSSRFIPHYDIESVVDRNFGKVKSGRMMNSVPLGSFGGKSQSISGIEYKKKKPRQRAGAGRNYQQMLH